MTQTTDQNARFERLTSGHAHSFRASTCGFRASPARAFTLVEMLVVIGIIGVLAALLLPAVMRAVTTARNTAIAFELNQLDSAIQAYKQDKGDYPPNFRQKEVVLRHIRKCYPKADPSYVMAFANYACGDTNAGANTVSFIDEGESLVFWLSMTDTNPRYPFLSYFQPAGVTTAAAPKKYYDFDESKLAPLDSSEAQSVTAGNFYDVRACLGKYSKETYYIYIDSRSYLDTCKFNRSPYSDGADSYAYAEDTSVGTRPYWSETVGNASVSSPNLRGRNKPMNATTFQLICAGQDGEFSDPTVDADIKFFPSGDNCKLEDRDNITNFSNGKTLKENVP